MIEFMNKLMAVMPSGAVLSGIGIVLEAVLRLIPSQKPLSVLYFVEDMLHAFAALGKATGDALNSILPQRIVQAPAPMQAQPAQAPQA